MTKLIILPTSTGQVERDFSSITEDLLKWEVAAIVNKNARLYETKYQDSESSADINEYRT